MHDLKDLPTEWQEYVHVDGKPYFRHETWGVVTEACIRDAEIRTKLETFYHQVHAARIMRKPGLKMSETFELYLTITPEPAYYFVDHATCSLFWLDDVPLDKIGIHSNGTFISFGK